VKLTCAACQKILVDGGYFNNGKDFCSPDCLLDYIQLTALTDAVREILTEGKLELPEGKVINKPLKYINGWQPFKTKPSNPPGDE